MRLSSWRVFAVCLQGDQPQDDAEHALVTQKLLNVLPNDGDDLALAQLAAARILQGVTDRKQADVLQRVA
jgi:hypothetical protein